MKPTEAKTDELWALAARAAKQAFTALCLDPTTGLYLWYKPAGMDLACAAESPAGYELGDPQTMRGDRTVEQMTTWIYERARRLPILKPSRRPGR